MPSGIEGPPVSVKAALRWGDTWVLLKNDRDEWELPGGRIDAGDVSMRDVVRRECSEELGVDVDVGPLIDSYLFEVVPGRRVVIVCFAATVVADATTELTLSHEHVEAARFTTAELDGLVLSAGYRSAIAHAAAVSGEN